MVGVSVDHGVVDEISGIEWCLVPPRERFDRDDFRGGFHFFNARGGVSEHPRAGIDRLPVGAEGERHGGWPLSDDIGCRDLAVRFVLRCEVVRVGRKARQDFVEVAEPAGAGLRVEPVRGFGIFFVVEPIGESEVPEADHWLDAGGLELAGHLDIAVDRLLVEDAGFGFHTAPLDAEAVVGDADFLEGGEVLVELRPRVKRVAFFRGLTLGDQHIPIGVEPIALAGFHIGIFVLIAGGRDAPREFFIQLRRGAWRTRNRAGGVATERVDVYAGGQSDR